jgi:Type IIA topoisomerase (DNA gyrase/topo II, topoisomerase IV), A subunit
MRRFGLSEVQSDAILEMKLRRLTGLERDKIESELAELLKEIEKLREILSNDELVYNIIKTRITRNKR